MSDFDIVEGVGSLDDLDDFDTLMGKGILTGDRQQALSRILATLLTTPDRGRPFIFSPGELRQAIRMAEHKADLTGNETVLNYEHPLLEDPVVSCASKQQLLDNLRVRFGVAEGR